MQTSPLQGYQLSLQQMHLWSLYQSNQSYRVQCAFKIIGPLHIEAFQLALQHVINRHEILQTTFYTVQGMDIPVQAITPTRYNLKVIDLSQYEESKQKALFAQLCATIGREQYNVAQGPLLRIAIVRFKEQEHVLLAELPALCADAATLARLITELIQKYTADRRGENSGTEDILQYADVAAWQEALFDEEDANDAISSWRTVDLAPLSTYHVPFEKKLRDEPSRAFRPQFAEIELPRELSTRLAALAGEYGASSEAFLFTCWQIFLWRLFSYRSYSTRVIRRVFILTGLA
jgi:NRPS condensation-like uncharacterized protein